MMGIASPITFGTASLARNDTDVRRAYWEKFRAGRCGQGLGIARAVVPAIQEALGV
jgi:hypothetical protein